ncbi:uncharacterized protein MEPE_01473 [Melanopsichium pennsylvanicum]|uniref:Uncharacterized protein n=2 Tax=Melanopsichium pennsylvanicum TaxID=63383 RepID=A0AAJ4XIQ2_9BASI|nr:conserved hypothetical protein [Melanopsichium pennsylvanicum 4]SNX82767.1 uncharacterized protein MEPE_01473 [Melanopsichium pennsylvanicum]
MDSDPFAVWDDPTPTPAPASFISASKDSKSAKEEEDVRLSLEYEDDDPGWGAALASTSRANSPEKSRKAASTTAHVTPIAGTTVLDETEMAVSSLNERRQELHTPASALDETPATGAAKQATATAEKTVPEESSTESDATLQFATEDGDDDEVTFKDSRNGQIGQNEVSLTPELTEEAVITAPTEEDDGFDDFGEPSGAASAGADHDDFGDFDNFETGDAQDDDDFDDGGFDEPAAVTEQRSAAPLTATPVPTRSWAPLDVTPRSNRLQLADSVNALLPLSVAAEKELLNVPLRQVEGLSQVLVSGESRQLLADLSTFPSVRPIDWVRSKTRRDYLISMGVPVNLDEIHSSFATGSAGSRQLPPLQLKYDSSAQRTSGSLDVNGSSLQRSSSLNVAGTCSGQTAAAQRSASTSNSPRNGSQSPALGSSANRERIAERRMQELGLGPAPQVDLRRAEELVNKTEDQLTLLSLPALKSILREFNTLTTSTSSLLTHHLTLRESYQADSEMYNSMIKDLVTGAASRFSGSGGGSNSVAGGRGDSRRSTTMGTSVSSSGKARVSSLPAGSAAMSGARSMSPSLRGGAGSSPRR